MDFEEWWEQFAKEYGYTDQYSRATRMGVAKAAWEAARKDSWQKAEVVRVKSAEDE